MSDNDYTVKEIVTDLSKDVKEAGLKQARIVASLENIDNHLEQLNSKVATHVKEIAVLKTDHKQAKAIFSTLSVV